MNGEELYQERLALFRINQAMDKAIDEAYAKMSPRRTISPFARPTETLKEHAEWVVNCGLWSQLADCIGNGSAPEQKNCKSETIK